MYDTCKYFRFHDITLIKILGRVFTFASNHYQKPHFSYLQDILIEKKPQRLLGSWQVQQSCLPSFMLAQKITLRLLPASDRTANTIPLRLFESQFH